MKSTTAFRISAVLGFAGVILGALGAHGSVHDLLLKNNALDTWETAARYHLIHAVLLLFLANLRPFPRGPWILITAGIMLFSGSLYLLGTTGMHWLGPVTPIGGLCLLAGWLWLAVASRNPD